MTKWTDRYSHLTPRDRFIIGRLPDGTEKEVEWNPMTQQWHDFDGKPCNNWTEWREITDD